MLGGLGLGDLEVMEELILEFSLLMTSNVMKIIINHGPDPSSHLEKKRLRNIERSVFNNISLSKIC